MNEQKNRWAIIDIGSNTIRLVIYEENPFGVLKEVGNIKATARLRHYLNDESILTDQGIEILIRTLSGFNNILQYHQVNKVRCVGTAAIRQALNQQEICTLVIEKTGLHIDVLSEEEEAYFGYYAVIHTTPFTEGITIDIGGGSTEITYFKDKQLIYSHSFPFGVVSLKQAYLKGNVMTDDENLKLKKFINESFAPFKWLKSKNVPIIAIGGSARNIAQIHQEMIEYPIAGSHQYMLSIHELSEIDVFLSTKNVGDLEKIEGLSRDRADLIVPALKVFVELCKYTKTDRFIVSRKGLRDGIYLKEHLHQQIGSSLTTVDLSLQELIYDFGINPVHSNRVSRFALQLANQLIDDSSKEKQSWLNVIEKAAKVYYIGQYIDSDASSQHSFYLLANRSIDNLLHKDRVKLALIASFKNKSQLIQYLNEFTNWFSKEEIDFIRLSGAIVKIASALDATKRGVIDKLEVEVKEKSVTLKIKGKDDWFVEQYQVEKQIHHLEKAIKKQFLLIYE